ncbi:c-type cytochrome [Croceibacterium salegens]|uniref:c-type cytochrome n=1 Tax=Croceibacterium salegens TaxID=1737568 RepID=UPI002E257461
MIKPNSKKDVLYAVLAAVAGIVAGCGMLAASAHAEEAPHPAHVDKDAARDLFNTYSCSACHSLTDAGATGSVGPSLDDPALTRDFIIGRVTNGQGAMPSFGGQLSDDEIALLADYIVEVNHQAPAQ